MTPLADNDETPTPAATRTFVGRERELTELCAALDEVIAGRGRFFLFAGEPGIGKTRLAEEFAGRASSRGVTMIWGRCWEHGGAPPFWPWIQILRAALAQNPAGGGVDDDFARLVRFLPELDDRRSVRAADRPQTAPADPQDRFPLFDAVGSYLRGLACRRPLLLLLDDLHAADTPSLLLLEFLAQELPQVPMFVVGTYRESDLQRRPERLAVVSRAGRSGTRLPLAGLAEAEVARLIEQRGAEPSPALLAALLHHTEGNPFFIDELVRLWLAGPAGAAAAFNPEQPLPIPLSVREAIGERLGTLSEACRETLALAAVHGREFDLARLIRSSRLGSEELLTHLGEACGSGIVRSVDASHRRYLFAHTLFREALYDQIDPVTRLLLHRRVGEALESMQTDDIDAHLPELAYHFQLVALEDGGKALTYTMLAGDQAMSQQAYEDAAAQYQNALQVLEGSTTLDGPARRCELLVRLGWAQRAASDDGARRTFERAAALARGLLQQQHVGAAAWLAQAALGYADRGIGAPQRTIDEAVVDLVKEALAALGPADGQLRARLLARLGMELSLAEDGGDGIALGQQAVEMARRLADHSTLAMTLSCLQYVLWRVDYIRERLSIANEVLRLAEGAGDKALALQGRSWRLVDLMSMGDVRTFDAEIDLQTAAADELRQARYQWLSLNLRTMRALWAGQWEAAERLALASMGLSERTGDETVAVSPWVQLFFADRERAALAKHESLVRQGVARFADTPTPRTLLAILCLDLGRTEEARALFEGLAAHDFDDLRRQRRIGVLPFLAELSVAFADRRRALLLEKLLQPFAEGIVPYGAAANFAAGAHYLGQLAALRGDSAKARQHFEVALALHERTEAKAWQAHTQFEFARFLCRAGTAADVARATTLLQAADTTATTLQMTALRQSIATELAAVPAATQAIDAPVPRANTKATSDYVFRRDGDYWSVGDAQSLLRLKDILGMRYVARLLQHPGRELLASELVALESTPELDVETLPFELRWRDDSLHVHAAGVGGEAQLDRSAKNAYRQRLEELRHDLDEATRFHDRDRATRARIEIEFLLRELSQALGLGGRDRPAGSAAERARLNVTRAIKAALKRIRQGNPSLGRYLETTIKTGTYCSYTPDTRLHVRWHC